MRSDNSSTGMKIIRAKNGKIIETAEGILCEYVNNDGNITLKFVQTHSSCSTSSSTTENASIMPCSITLATTQENNYNKNIEKFFIAHDFLLSSSDTSNDEELQYICLMQKKKKLRTKHCIRNVIDQYTEEETFKKNM
ncbi:PREDICTED: uncharacterized protein LOC105453622 isoform X2 [Wasmannia auropunctata]|uniref:uncharacterized protein LOC105453622 isoform X2 n=1 Tax=Wasmannia auropunctata TaxID=64793 RepID=UPI0005F08C20|nr:PREDICTED: uncharacterized protein LOC105453622 isoform X2 [Wasmannia auropunctata]